MKTIGYALVLQATGEELQTWTTFPREITYKGETRTGATVGAEIGYDAWFVPRVLFNEPPVGNPPVVSESGVFENGQVVVTRVYGDPQIDQMKQNQVDRIKGEASNLILDKYPSWKQTNMVARGVELLAKGQANWTQEEAAEVMALQAVWDKIKDVRTHSNTLETEVNSLTDAQSIHDWVPTGWPEI